MEVQGWRLQQTSVWGSGDYGIGWVGGDYSRDQ